MCTVRLVTHVKPGIRLRMADILGYDPYPGGKLILKEWRGTTEEEVTRLKPIRMVPTVGLL